MKTKLTLKLNKRSIERAKKNKQSLSVLVENYFNMIAKKDFTGTVEISPNVLELSGIINISKSSKLKQIYRKHLEALL